MTNSRITQRATRNANRRRTRLLEERADMLSITDSPKEYLFEINCDGYEEAGAPKGTMCMLQNRRPAKYGRDLVLILIHNGQCNNWLFGYLLHDGIFDYLFEPERKRLVRLLDGTYTLCGVLAPLVAYKFQPDANDDVFRQIAKQFTAAKGWPMFEALASPDNRQPPE
ncbi:MAG: hypothetical protein ABI977_02130 [Acidobacteriota bacterium]